MSPQEYTHKTSTLIDIHTHALFSHKVIKLLNNFVSFNENIYKNDLKNDHPIEQRSINHPRFPSVYTDIFSSVHFLSL